MCQLFLSEMDRDQRRRDLESQFSTFKVLRGWQSSLEKAKIIIITMTHGRVSPDLDDMDSSFQGNHQVQSRNCRSRTTISYRGLEKIFGGDKLGFWKCTCDAFAFSIYVQYRTKKLSSLIYEDIINIFCSWGVIFWKQGVKQKCT